VGSGEGSPVAGLQEFPRSPDSAEKKRKLAQTFLKSLIWRVKKGGGTRKEESCYVLGKTGARRDS